MKSSSFLSSFSLQVFSSLPSPLPSKLSSLSSPLPSLPSLSSPLPSLPSLSSPLPFSSFPSPFPSQLSSSPLLGCLHLVGPPHGLAEDGSRNQGTQNASADPEVWLVYIQPTVALLHTTPCQCVHVRVVCVCVCVCVHVRVRVHVRTCVCVYVHEWCCNHTCGLA